VIRWGVRTFRDSCCGVNDLGVLHGLAEFACVSVSSYILLALQ